MKTISDYKIVGEIDIPSSWQHLKIKVLYSHLYTNFCCMDFTGEIISEFDLLKDYQSYPKIIKQFYCIKESMFLSIKRERLLNKLLEK